MYIYKKLTELGQSLIIEFNEIFYLAEDIELKEQQTDLSCPPQHLVAEDGCYQEA